MSDHPMINLSIDGQAVSVKKGTLLVEACREAGIEVPVYCYHPKLAPVGACRVCVVEVVGGRPKPIMPACTTEVMEGMVVNTRSDSAVKAREGVLEFLLINHPLDCPVCDRAGECDLQDFTLRYGPPNSRFVEIKRHFEKSEPVGRDVILDRERCIMCWRCVRFCNEVAVEEGLTLVERGTKAHIGVFPGQSYDSQFSGNTIEICPVGALTSKSYRFHSRPWELQNFASVCTHCSMGCNLTVDVRYYDVARFRSRCNDAIDDGWLCDRGRYGYQFIHSDKRLKSPLVRKNGQLVEVGWEEALKAAADGLKTAGAEAVAVAGPRISNEAAWMLMRLMRSVLGSGHIDHQRGPARSGGGHPWPTKATIAGLDSATAVVVVNSDPTSEQPVLDLRIKKALRRGAGLIVVNPAATGLDRYADVKLDSLADLQSAYDAFQKGEPPELHYPKPRPWESGGKTSRSAQEAAEILHRSPAVTVITSQHAITDEVLALVEATAGSDQAPHGLMITAPGANSRGLLEMGVTADLGPGLQTLKESEKALSEAWGSFCAHQGDAYARLVGSKRKAMLALGVASVGEKADFVVACDLVLSPLAEQADVVLPASSFYEQTATLTNFSGICQVGRQTIAPVGNSRPDYQILVDLIRALGQICQTDTPARIYAEIGRLNPLYQGASYDDFVSPAALHWSYPQQGRIGTPRPDLSAIPTHRPDAPPWMTVEPTGSRVESVARMQLSEGTDMPPQVPGQEDPRRMAARLSLLRALEQAEAAAGEPQTLSSRAVETGQGPQPPGPSPAHRYHDIGVQPRSSLRGAEALSEPEAEQAPTEEVTP